MKGIILICFSQFLESGLIHEISKRNPITNSTKELELCFYPKYYKLSPPELNAKQSILKAGQFLTSGKSLISDNGKYKLVIQTDGNLCIYDGNNNIWCSNSAQGNNNYFLTMQTDGNLSVYRGKGPSDNQGNVWNSNTSRGQGNYFAVIQNDGKLGVYRGTGPTDNQGNVWIANNGGGGGGGRFHIPHIELFSANGETDTQNIQNCSPTPENFTNKYKDELFSANGEFFTNY